ncbi:MAG: MFS transporter [Acidimicrobiales bacterium]
MLHSLSTPATPTSSWHAFRTYWTGAFVSMIGDSFTLVALPVAAYAIDRSPILVGLVDMMEILSGILFGSLLGVLADRSDARVVMWVSDLVRAGLLAVLALLAYFEAGSAWTILVVAFALGVFRAFHDGGESSLLAVIVPPDHELQAFARLNVADSTGRLIGPFVGGLAIELGIWVAFGIDAATFTLAAIAVILLPRTRQQRQARAKSLAERPAASAATLRSDFTAALAAMRARPTYLVLVGIGAFANLAGLTMAGLFVPFAVDVLHLRSVGFGFGALLALVGCGGLAANWFVNRQTHHDPRAAGLSGLPVAATVVLAGAVPSLVTSVIAMLTSGAGIAYFQANYSAYRQRVFPAEMLGRVAMVTRTIFYTTMMVGFLTGGVIAESVGPDRMMMIFGGVSMAGILAIGFIPIDRDPDVGRRPSVPAGGAA